ncbi:hypothetical protein D9M71_415940 [compost metagenome]
MEGGPGQGQFRVHLYAVATQVAVLEQVIAQHLWVGIEGIDAQAQQHAHQAADVAGLHQLHLVVLQTLEPGLGREAAYRAETAHRIHAASQVFAQHQGAVDDTDRRAAVVHAGVALELSRPGGIVGEYQHQPIRGLQVAVQSVDRQRLELQRHALAAGEALQQDDGIAFGGVPWKGAVIRQVVLAFQAHTQRLRFANAEEKQQQRKDGSLHREGLTGRDFATEPS